MFSKKLAFILSAAAVSSYLGTGSASAQQIVSDSAVVTYEVEAITQLNLNGSASVKVVYGTAGAALPFVTDSTGVTYDITNNAGAGSMKLIGKISSVMPTGTTLSVNVTAPTSGTSAGLVALTDEDQALVTAIGNVNDALVAISFRLDATVAAGIVASATKTFTMTITAS